MQKDTWPDMFDQFYFECYRFVRFWTVKEAEEATESLNNMPIGPNGVKLLVRPPKSRQQNSGAVVASSKEAPMAYRKEATKPAAQHFAKQLRMPHVKSSPNNDGNDDDDDDNVWDDGLLPKHVNGRHSDDGVVNGMTTLDISDTSSGSLREMFVSEVCSHSNIVKK